MINERELSAFSACSVADGSTVAAEETSWSGCRIIVRTVNKGEYKGVRGVGLAFAKQRRERAAALAMAIAVCKFDSARNPSKKYLQEELWRQVLACGAAVAQRAGAAQKRVAHINKGRTHLSSGFP